MDKSDNPFDSAAENDLKIETETRAKLLTYLPDEDLLNLYSQAVINRAVRAASEVKS